MLLTKYDTTRAVTNSQQRTGIAKDHEAPNKAGALNSRDAVACHCDLEPPKEK